MNKGIDPSTLQKQSIGPAAISGQAVPASGPAGRTCGGAGHSCGCGGDKSTTTGFVYAIGTIEAEYPTMAIEREMQIIGHALGVDVEPDADMPVRSTEAKNWQHAVLSRDRKLTRYLARKLSWRLTVEDSPVFVLIPRDSADFDGLIDCLARPKYQKRMDTKRKGRARTTPDSLVPSGGQRQDLDVVIGVAGSRTPDGIEVLVDQVFTIKPDQMTPRAFLNPLADNYGLTDEERAYNYLTARYEISANQLEVIHKDYELAGVRSLYSRLSGENRRVVRLIYTFRSKSPNSPAERKYFLRVDVTDEFPFIVTPWKRYLQRGEEQ